MTVTGQDEQLVTEAWRLATTIGLKWLRLGHVWMYQEA